MARKLLLVALTVLAAAGPAFPASLEELAGTERAAALRSAEGPVTELQQKNPVPRLLPAHAELRRLVAETMESLQPGLFVETLSLYKKPRAAAWSEAERAGLFNSLTALSTLSGIRYYSESRKTMRVFYESSFVIESPSDKRPLPDPAFASPPPSLALYASQKDLTFGGNVYRFDYYTAADAILMVQENLTAMNAGIIPAVGKNKFRTVMAVIDSDDSLLIYAAAMAKASPVPGMGDRIGLSFANRVKAILAWFTARAGEVFQQ
ncbi:MAG: hypothetical protein FWH38_07210 [Treponema sp.]|nr:hypothetical protein [Treponema sp.]